MRKRRLFLLLPVSMLLLAACGHPPEHHEYYGVASSSGVPAPPVTDNLWWDRTGSTAIGSLTLGLGSEPKTGLAVSPQAGMSGAPLPAGTYRLAITFTADTFAAVVFNAGGKEAAKATGIVTTTGVDLTVAPPQTAPITISFTSTGEGTDNYLHER